MAVMRQIASTAHEICACNAPISVRICWLISSSAAPVAYNSPAVTSNPVYGHHPSTPNAHKVI
jgi:hypothetical protein